MLDRRVEGVHIHVQDAPDGRRPGSAARGSESTPALLAQFGDFLPLDARGGQDDALGDAVAALHHHLVGP